MFCFVLAALAATAGHIWSIFLKLHGGRGVAVFFAGMLILHPVVGLSAGALMFIIIGLTRYASLGSIAGAIASCVILISLTIIKGYPFGYMVYALIGAIIIISMHRDNIVRLLAGNERKIGEKADKGGLAPST